ncbi:GntR family transcriptional regulator [Sesbania bispinosa]|nr:GntR family transcriptional regulator [Sesbania bispinosa]
MVAMEVKGVVMEGEQDGGSDRRWCCPMHRRQHRVAVVVVGVDGLTTEFPESGAKLVLLGFEAQQFAS